MISSAFRSIAARLMRQPAVAFHEHAVRAEVEAICSEFALPCHRDPHGNLLVRLKTSAASRPLALAAHMDHPGFEITGRHNGTRLRARFLGGVPDRYFISGTRLRLMPGAEP